MRRIAALALAALVCLCLYACGEKPPGPEKSSVLLTLYADKQPLRIVTQQEGVTVTLQQMEFEPTLLFMRPYMDVWEETLEPGREYEFPAEVFLGETIPHYQLLARQGENMAVRHLMLDMKDGNEIFEIEGGPWAPAPIDENSAMINLCRAAAVASGDMDNISYWYIVANAISTQRGVYNEWPPDDTETGAYHVPGWLVDAYADALFPGVEMPSPLDSGAWVGYANAEYLVYLAYSTWIWGDYKGAKQNPDGTWDVTITITLEDFDEDYEEVIKLAPNKEYNPNSPFEYHIVGLRSEPPEGYEPPEPAPPPPGYIVGAWCAPVKRGHMAWLEIYVDGMAGLYLGDDESDQVYEIYNGLVSYEPGHVSETSVELDMRFDLGWHIYESDDGSPVAGVPDSYKGTYILRHDWEGGQQVLHVTTKSGDELFGQKELKLLWTPKTLEGGSMVDMEAMG